MKKSRFILGLALTILLSCSRGYQDQEINIYGYMIGDTLTSEFTLEDSSKSIYQSAIFKDDNRFEIALIDKYIYMMNFSDLNSKEHAYYKKLISDKLKTKPEYFSGENQFNLKVEEGGLLYWIDTETKTEYMLSPDTIPRALKHSLFMMNKTVSDSLLEIFVADPDVEYDIMYPE